MGLDGNQFAKGFNSDTARRVLDEKIDAAATDPAVAEELKSRISKLNRSTLEMMKAELTEAAATAGDDIEQWKIELKSRPKISGMLGGTILGAMLGAAGGPIAIAAGMIGVPAVLHGTDKMLRQTEIFKTEVFLEGIKTMQTLIDEQLTAGESS